MSQEGKRHIVIIGPAHPFRGGIADTNEAMARAFIKQGFKVDLVTFTVQYPDAIFPGKSQYSDEGAPQDLNIHRWIHSFNPFNWLKAARKINALNPDVVVIRYWLPLMAPCFGSIAALLRSSIKIVGLTDNVIPHEKRLLDKAFTAYFMRFCDGFMALSKAVEKDLKQLTSKPTSYFPHPINDQLGERIGAQEAKEKLGLDPDARYLLFFGFIRKYKGLDLLLEAMGDERVKNLGVKLIVAGESYEKMDEYYDLIKSHNIKEHVILRNEFIPSDEVPAYFCAADLITQTYRTATQSGITQMALHFEVPALITKVGGLEEFIIEGKTGEFCKPDPSDIASKIVEFFNQEDKKYKAAIKVEKKRFTWQAFVEHFISWDSTTFTT